MSTPVDRPSAAATDLTGPGGWTAAVDALARVLDPDAFEPCAVLTSVHLLWVEAARRETARVHAQRALAAGYRLVSEEPSS